MTAVHNFTLKIEACLSKRKARLILGTRNVNDVSIYVWLIHFLIKLFKKIQCKKEYSKYTKITMKNYNKTDQIRN